MTSLNSLIIVVIFAFLAACTGKNQGDSYAKVDVEIITKIKISYCPSFTNAAVLTLDRSERLFTFDVDTIASYSFGRPERVKMPLSGLERATDITTLYNREFIKGIQSAAKRHPLIDGTTICIYRISKDFIDSVCSGNNYSDTLRQTLKEPLLYMERNSNDKALKGYLRLLIDQM